MVFSLQKNEERGTDCAVLTDRIQTVFYISFYRVIQEDAWEKARERRRGGGPDLFARGLLCFS